MKIVTISGTSEDKEKLDLSHISAGKAKGNKHKAKCAAVIELSNCTLSCSPGEIKTHFYTKSYTQMSTETSSVTAKKTRNKPNVHQQTNE